MAYDYDVIIVGGGLGGSSLGQALARHGIDVLVIEKEAMFRDRVRGEYIHPWGVTEMRLLGIYELLLQTCGLEVRYRYNHIVGMPPARRRDMVKSSPHQVGSMHFYHPSMQENLLNAAVEAGVKRKRGVVREVTPGSNPSVQVRTVEEGEQTYAARLVVGADGRNSNCRKWMGFEALHDTERLVIGGVLFDNLEAPEDEVNFFINPVRGNYSVFMPLGKKRFRGYAGFYQQEGYQRWSGEKMVNEFIEACVSAGAPREWFAQVSIAGPLASFSCADNWVESPAARGVVLVGDAAATSDPSYGCGLSLALRDVRVLSGHLLADEDWENGIQAYAREHDRYFGSIHRQLDWLTRLFYEPGDRGISRREKVFARILEDPHRLPDIPGLGPEGPSDDEAYFNLFGEELR